LGHDAGADARVWVIRGGLRRGVFDDRAVQGATLVAEVRDAL